MQNTPLIFCIDVEPDERDFRDPRDWEGFEKIWAYVREIRAPLERATGAPVHFSWFLCMDPQIHDALNLGFHSSVIRRMFDVILARRRSRHLALVIRSDAGHHPAELANVEQSVEHLLGHAQVSQFRIATPAEAVALLG